MKQPMSDDSRRLLCRLIFIALCLLPTAVVVYRIFHPVTPQQWSQRLQATLGIDALIDRVETPQPNITILRSVHIRDSQLRTLARLGSVRIATDSQRRINVDEPVTMSAAGLANLLQRLPEYLLHPGADQGVWKVELRQLTIADGPWETARDQRTFSPVEIQVQRDDEQIVCLLRCRLLGQTEPGEPIELLATRTRDGESWRESIRFSTGVYALPTWLVSDLEIGLVELGDRCHFRGHVSADRAPRGWNGQFAGVFTHLDLEHLADQSGLALGGTSRLVVRRCDFFGYQIGWLDASLESQYGWIGALALRGREQLQPTAVTDDRVLYSRLSCALRYVDGYVEVAEFELRDRQNVQLHGGGQAYCQVGLEPFVRAVWGEQGAQSPITDAMVNVLHRFQIISIPRTAAAPR